ncbi:MAG: phosphoribosyl-ATP diphosphatase [Ignisphaera sp.]|uniref:Phosphoribosyl-ATP pyrophosphatase n=1 Tax=Ignisphaera aggregans TaxID=334771 RepID=A0A7C4H6G7_9CREN
MDLVLAELYSIIVDRIEKKPTNSYTVQLVSKGIEYVARKFGEESIEVIVAALTESRERFISEVADLLYHLLVLMVLKNITPEDIAKELLRRRK